MNTSRSDKPKNSLNLHDILDELSLMQSSNDLLERYQCFIRIAESSLTHALGQCGLTLWWPDDNNENLTECIIEPTRPAEGIPSRTLLENVSVRPACKIPLDSEVIDRSLSTQEPYLGLQGGTGQIMLGRSAESTLLCDACIPLPRNYGPPLLIIAERLGKTAGPCRREEFYASVELIRLFWKQLQATNQRQWLIEHDPTSRALRDEVFLQRGQTWAQRFKRRDELFTLVVITVRGFRSIFTGNSQQWRRLSAVVGRCLSKVLQEKSPKFLLGKMADDVFALMLPSKNNFLTDAVMHAIATNFGEEMTQDRAAEALEMVAIDIQWAIADHQSYQGNLEQLLNQIYRDLFSQTDHEHKHTHRIILSDPEREVDIQPCK